MKKKIGLIGTVVIGLAALFFAAYKQQSEGDAIVAPSEAVPTIRTSQSPESMALVESTRPENLEQEAAVVNQLSSFKGAESLPQTEQASLWTAFSDARRAIRPLTEHQKTMPENEGALYLASNPGQKIRARFLDDGVRLLSGYAGREWNGVLSLATEGDVLEVRQQGTQIEYVRDGIIEWYHNKPEGLEHGYIIESPTTKFTKHTKGQLVVPVEFQGLEVQEFEEGGLQFVNEAGEPVLSYSKLKVWDANGAMLAASMEPTASGLNFLIADAGAAYPITIDPLIASLEAKLGPEVTGNGVKADFFGGSVSMDGGTAIIGATGDDDNGSSSGSAYVFISNGTNWSVQAKLAASDGAINDYFGQAVSVSGDTALVGANGDDDNGNGSGSAYVFKRSGTNWIQQAKLAGTATSASDSFGYSVCVSGNTALVGADGAFYDMGYAYVFIENGTNWSQQAKLSASDAAVSKQFGQSVSVEGDTALIGSPSDSSAYVFTRSGTNWSEQAKLIGSDTTNYDRLGAAVSVSGDTALVGASRDNDMGSAYVFTRNGTNWVEQAKLMASDAALNDSFGYAVSVDVDTALIGAYVNDDAGSGSGSAYVFARSGSIWSEQAKLTASDATDDCYFGASVTLDGNTVLVGASVADVDGVDDVGSAYVFTRNGSNWSEQEKLTAGDAAVNDQFGISVSLGVDTALIGSCMDDDGGNSSGSAYIFVRGGTNWSEQAKITASDAAADDLFGYSVSMSGNTALVGAYGDDDNGSSSGSAYVFVRSGSNWNEQVKLTAGDAHSEDWFGYSVSISGDTALVGANQDDDSGGYSGSAYVFVRSGNNWNAQAKLTAGDAASWDYFGNSVSIDGDTALIGASYGNSAYVFLRNGTNWYEQAKLIASDAAGADYFGYSGSIDGDTALVGAYGNDDNGSSSGSAYVFVRSGTNWTQQGKLTAGDGAASDWFGYSVSLNGDTALVGAYYDDTAVANSGSAYVFIRNGTSWSEQAKLTASTPAVNDRFGVSVSVYGDTVLVGAILGDGLDVDGGPAPDQGFVNIYRLIIPSGDIAVEGPSGFLADGGSEGFGYQAVGVGKILVLTISNESIGDLSGLSIAKDGVNAAAFEVGALASTSLANGEFTTFRITFTPSSETAHNAAIHIYSNDPDESPFDINLSGTGLANADTDPGSDAWEVANGFDPNVAGDVMTLDSDGDGDPDIWELFQGTDRNGSGDSYGFQATEVGAGEALTTQYRRSTTQSAVTAQYVWTCGLVDCTWYYPGESDGAVGIEVTETVVGSGPGYEIVEVSAQPVTGSPDTLFFTLELSPNE